MTMRDIAERRRNAEQCRKEQAELSARIAERKAARCAEAIVRLTIWKQAVQSETDRRGLSC